MLRKLLQNICSVFSVNFQTTRLELTFITCTIKYFFTYLLDKDNTLFCYGILNLNFHSKKTKTKPNKDLTKLKIPCILSVGIDWYRFLLLPEVQFGCFFFLLLILGCTKPDGDTVPIGGTYADDCNTCTCRNDGTISCTDRVCSKLTEPYLPVKFVICPLLNVTLSYVPMVFYQ